MDPVYLPDPDLPRVAAVGDDIDGSQRPLWMPVHAEHHPQSASRLVRGARWVVDELD